MIPSHIALLCGGGDTEHEVSLRSADFIEDLLTRFDDLALRRFELDADGIYHDRDGKRYRLTAERSLQSMDDSADVWPLDAVIPCIHGFPGETGDLQASFDLIGLPYLGCGSEASKLCINKISSKLWFSALGIPNTPYCFVTDLADTTRAHAMLAQHGNLFVKAASQGSSVGCYQVATPEALDQALKDALAFGPYVLVEQTLVARELELAAYEIDGELVITAPGEILTPDDAFYSYEEKYDSSSHTETAVKAGDLSDEQIAQMQDYARRAFTGLNLRHLSRIDFFLTRDGEIYLNEINTFPGMTPISMFPKMQAAHGHDNAAFFYRTVKSLL
ncbi:D-alanine--D-alanine ligase [Ferrimonas pelagia]|uniref:D-alanine--D-alanine ligase n=1 Tax=Ferrimonas pelagia TaxID=1177826 RepID=A0ABP9F5T2_9GAMM